MNDLASWAESVFVSVGGVNWRDDLTLGGITVVALLVIIAGLLAIALVRGRA